MILRRAVGSCLLAVFVFGSLASHAQVPRRVEFKGKISHAKPSKDSDEMEIETEINQEQIACMNFFLRKVAEYPLIAIGVGGVIFTAGFAKWRGKNIGLAPVLHGLANLATRGFPDRNVLPNENHDRRDVDEDLHPTDVVNIDNIVVRDGELREDIGVDEHLSQEDESNDDDEELALAEEIKNRGLTKFGKGVYFDKKGRFFGIVKGKFLLIEQGLHSEGGGHRYYDDDKSEWVKYVPGRK